MPKLAAFPKAVMHALCKDGTMKLEEWIHLASTLEVEGLEWYAGFLDMEDQSKWQTYRKMDDGYCLPIYKKHPFAVQIQDIPRNHPCNDFQESR